MVEVRTGFEPAYNGFANRCLTTWLPHHTPRPGTESCAPSSQARQWRSVGARSSRRREDSGGGTDAAKAADAEKEEPRDELDRSTTKLGAGSTAAESCGPACKALASM